MRELKLTRTGVTVGLYDDIHELPEYKYSAFQIALVQDAGMGSSIEDIDIRLAKHDSFYSAGKIPEALRERQNMRLGLFFLLEGISTTAVCLAHLVGTVNGLPVADQTDEDILITSKIIVEGGITHGALEDLKETIKKKLVVRLNYITPN